MENYKPISPSDIAGLVSAAQNGDADATERLIEGNFPLIKSIVKTYLGKGTEYDDLYQIGCVGFLKAIKNFNPDFDVKFTTYAVPMISGEIKRFLRDDGSVKVSRAIKTLAIKLKAFIESYKSEKGETPQIEILEKEFDASKEDIVVALDSCQQLLSLQAKVDEADQNSQNVIDRLVVEDGTNDMLDKFILKSEIMKLPSKERQIIIFRYYRGKTQGEVAELLGISQVQVSRLESKIIAALKDKLEIKNAPAAKA